MHELTLYHSFALSNGNHLYNNKPVAVWRSPLIKILFIQQSKGFGNYPKCEIATILLNAKRNKKTSILGEFRGIHIYI